MTLQTRTACGESAACRRWKAGAAMRKALLSAGLVLILLACAALPAPLAFPAATPSETARPRASRTHRPTRTPPPTETLADSPSATLEPASLLTPTVPFTVLTSPPPTALPASPAPTSRQPSAMDCKLIWQSPPNGAVYFPQDQFTVGWNIRNIGTATWDPNSLALVHVAGARISPTELVHLPKSVAPGASVVLSVPIRAPRHLGVYTTHWALLGGTAAFCRLTLTIQVQAEH